MTRMGNGARGGQVIPQLLTQFLDDPFFLKPSPKSTGSTTSTRSG